MIEYWPIAVVVGTGLLAHGRQSARIDSVVKSVDEKASKESVTQIRADLERIDGKLDRLLERHNDAA